MVSSSVPARVLIVDDHPIVRLGVRELIGSDPSLTVTGEADSAEAALDVVRTSRVDLAIVDLSLGATSGLDLIRRLLEVVPKLRILVLSVHDHRLFAERTLSTGAAGYLTKKEAAVSLVHAIHEVLDGKRYVSVGSPGPATDAPRERPPRNGTTPVRVESLTNRELQVLEMIGRGLSSAAIADRLKLSIKTVETYRSNIKTKLDLDSASALVRYAAIWLQGI
jgi:DNA-binding NarL/FixJ family response regulator